MNDVDAQLLTGDLDNNGGTDIVVTTKEESQILLQDQDYAFYSYGRGLALETFALSATRFAGQLEMTRSKCRSSSASPLWDLDFKRISLETNPTPGCTGGRGSTH